MDRPPFGMHEVQYSRTAQGVRTVGLIALPATTGILLSLAFPPLDCSELAWVALVPFLIALVLPTNGIELYLGAYLGGVVFQLSNVDWIRTLNGGTGLSGPHATQWLIQGVLLAGFWPIAMLFGRPFVKKSRLPMAASLPVVWVVFEYIRMRGWAIVDSTGLPWGQLGLTRWEDARLTQMADLGGVYAITAIVAGVNGLILDVTQSFVVVFRREGQRSAAPSLIGIATVLALSWFYGEWRLAQVSPLTGPVVCLMPQQSLGVFTPSIAPSTPDDAGIDSAIHLIPIGKRDGRFHPDLLVWSEGAYPGVLNPGSSAFSTDGLAAPHNPSRAHSADSNTTGQQENLFDEMAQFANRYQAALLIGGTRRTDADNRSDRYNTAMFIDPHEGFTGCYDKIWLVPFSEFQPDSIQLFDSRTRDRFARGHQYPIFPVRASGNDQTYSMAVAICYDVCFPALFRRYMIRPNGDVPPDFFAVPAHESQDQTLVLQTSLLRQAQFRAIECRRAIVRNVDGGYSGIVDANGQLIASPLGVVINKPVILGPVPIDARRSPYVLWGDCFPGIASLTMVIIVLLPAGAHASGKSIEPRV